MFGVSSSDEKHDDGNRNDKHDGPEIRLEGQEKHNGRQERHIRKKPAFERCDLRPSPLEKIGKVQDRRQFYEFYRLEGKRKERYVDPSPRPIVHDPYEQHDHEGYEASKKEVLRVFFEYGIRRFYDEREQKESDNDVGDIAYQVEMIVRFVDFPSGRHERRNLERRIYAHRADHDHSENDEREDDEKYSVVDGFIFHFLKINGYAGIERKHDAFEKVYSQKYDERGEIQSGKRRRKG